MITSFKIPKQFKTKTSDVFIGQNDNFFNSMEKLSEGQLNHHVHILGASGFGKSVLLNNLSKQFITQGKGMMLLDLKCDIETILKLLKYAQNAGRLEDVEIFSLSSEKMSKSYNIIGRGSATELRDRIMLSLNWSEEYYKSQAASYLLKVLIGLVYLRDHRGCALDISTLLKAITDAQFVKILSQEIPETQTKEKECLEACRKFLSFPDEYKSLQGLRAQLESLVLSDFGDSLKDSDISIDLFDSVTSNKIVLIFLDTRRFGEAAQAIGKFIIQDLKSVSAKIDNEIKREDRRPFKVIIDEFADLAQDDFISFLDRARSARISILVCHQEVADLLRISPEFAGRLMGNTSTVIAFLQKRSESAESLAGIAGTKKAWKETHQAEKKLFMSVPTGQISRREVEEYVIHPNVLKKLRVGECVVIKKYPEARAQLVKVFPDVDYV